jgi:hypothetical protein
VFAYNNLPPVPRERLTTPAVEARCDLATAALDTLCETAKTLSDPFALLQTVALIEAQASPAIEGIVTSVREMVRYIGGLHEAPPETGDALLHHHEAILDAAPPPHRPASRTGAMLPSGHGSSEGCQRTASSGG